MFPFLSGDGSTDRRLLLAVDGVCRREREPLITRLVDFLLVVELVNDLVVELLVLLFVQRTTSKGHDFFDEHLGSPSCPLNFFAWCV